MEILDGKNYPNKSKRKSSKRSVCVRKKEKNTSFGSVIGGNDGASLTYVGSKVRSCEQVGFKSTIRLEAILPSSSSK